MHPEWRQGGRKGKALEQLDRAEHRIAQATAAKAAVERRNAAAAAKQKRKRLNFRRSRFSGAHSVYTRLCSAVR